MIALLLACTGSTPEPEPAFDYPLDDVLRISHGQVLGTHNSYHIAPESTSITDEWDYTHDPLDVQLSEQGVRQFELDVRWSEDDELFEVFHVPVVDEGTTCRLFVECLAIIRDWSDANPAHFPITVLVEPKDEFQETLWQERIEEFELEIRLVIPADQRFTPDQLQGSYGSVREAVEQEGWPTLGALRGRVIFGLLDRGEARDAYSDDLSSVAGRALFVDPGDPEHPLAALALMDDPWDPAIPGVVEAGLLVRTRADAHDEPLAGDTSRLEAALASGAHWLSTDYPAPVEGVDYLAEVPGGEPVGCNPISAPAECTARDLEDPAFMQSAR